MGIYYAKASSWKKQNRGAKGTVPCLIPVNSPILKIRVCKGEKGYLVFGFNYTDKDFEGNVTAPIEDKEVTLFFSVPADDVSILEIDYENRKEEL